MAGMDVFDAPNIADSAKPYVSFERGEPKEDRAETIRQQRPVYREVYYACITAPGSKDRLKEEIPAWWEKLEQQVKANRIPEAWVEKWRTAFERWQRGLEIPEDGTPILGWNLAVPSVQRMLVDLNIRTVEALAAASDEAKARIGMGALELQRRARAWLDQQHQGPTAIELSSLRKENEDLKLAVSSLQDKLRQLVEKLDAEPEPAKPEPAKRGPGRPRKEEATP